MTSFASPPTRLPVALARAAVVRPSPPVPHPRGRHAAPDAPGAFEIMGAQQPRSGRHSEPEWAREAFDDTRDEDPFEWLGFSA